MTAKTALLIIDVQQALCGGEFCAFEIDRVVANINALSARARAAGLPVVFVQHEELGSPMQHDSPGWQLHPGLVTAPSDLRVRKTASDAFHRTELTSLLQSHGVDALIVCGLQTEYCVDSTVRRALALGHPVQLVSDAHSTWSNGVLNAPQIIAHHNTTLGWLDSYGVRATIVAADDVKIAA